MSANPSFSRQRLSSSRPPRLYCKLQTSLGWSETLSLKMKWRSWNDESVVNTSWAGQRWFLGCSCMYAAWILIQLGDEVPALPGGDQVNDLDFPSICLPWTEVRECTTLHTKRPFPGRGDWLRIRQPAQRQPITLPPAHPSSFVPAPSPHVHELAVPSLTERTSRPRDYTCIMWSCILYSL